MKHAREDYNRIQDPAGLIGEDEPVFLLRAKDKTAPNIVRKWAMEQVNQGSEDPCIEVALKWADTMEEWQKVNGCKLADLP
jgi:hypothetical protein